MNGMTDLPTTSVQQDLFNVKLYIEGLSHFITQCNTPMTIAIQGDWGSGKTSIMNMVRENLCMQVVWFNTWQYSQFRMGDELPLALLSSLLDALFSTKDDMEKYEFVGKTKKSLRIIKRKLRSTLVPLADSVSAGKIAEAAMNFIDDEDTSIVQVIGELKDQFQECIDKICKIRGQDRIAIFIDDLDRLHPEQAVELLEVLKVFLDCEKCVFVLAIDYEVVSQGIGKKYGDRIGIEKGRSFFDKIIQVPFKMPVAQYDIKQFVFDNLDRMGISVPADSLDINSYVDLIATSIGRNPRSIKRLFNAFTLLNNMAIFNIDDNWKQKMLFAILCLQMSFEECFNYIIELGDSLDDNFFRSLMSDERNDSVNNAADSLEEELREKIYKDLTRKLKYDDDRLTALSQFMVFFSAVIDTNGDNLISQDELDAFRSVLYFSTITATGNAATTPKSAKANRYAKEYEEKSTYRSLYDCTYNKQVSWVSAKFEEIRFFNKTVVDDNLSSYMDFVLEILWNKDQEKMKEIIDNPKKFGLGAYFNKEKYDSPHVIPGTEFQFETKNGADQKRDFFVNMLRAYDISTNELEIKCRLAFQKQ